MTLKTVGFILAGAVGAVAVVPLPSFADGPLVAYDDPAISATLDPNEYLINADGAKEDSNAKMSDVARAYRNGLINGRKEAQTGDVPPLPDTMPEDQTTPAPAAVAQGQAHQRVHQPTPQTFPHPPVGPTTVVQLNPPTTVQQQTPVQPQQLVMTNSNPGVYTTTDEYHTKVVHQTKNLTPDQYLQEQQILHAQPVQSSTPSVQVNYQYAPPAPQGYAQVPQGNYVPPDYAQEQAAALQQQRYMQQQYAQTQVPNVRAYSPGYYVPSNGPQAYVVHRLPQPYYAPPPNRQALWAQY